MTNRRDDSFVAVTRLIDERSVAALHLLFDHATPTDAMIGQLAIPLVVIKSHLTRFEILFRSFAFAPSLSAVKLIKLAFRFRVPGIEQLACVATLRLAIAFTLGQHFFSKFARVFLILFVR